ncbi:MAG: hypothetical protein ACREOE_15280, partial [Gemmatimonadales bacterium]
LTQDLSFDEIVRVQYEPVTGSLDDLINRLVMTDAVSPRQIACTALASGLEPDTSFLGSLPQLPSPHHERRAAGPNIIIAVSGGSAADLALLWNLRAARRRQMPAYQRVRPAR